jgi:hypothetical protein
LHLQDLGIISGVDGLGLSVTYTSNFNDKFEYVLIAKDKILILRNDNVEKECSSKVYFFTSLGKEIISLTTSKVDLPYLEAVAHDYWNKGFTVYIADYLGKDDKSIHHSNIKKYDPVVEN